MFCCFSLSGCHATVSIKLASRLLDAAAEVTLQSVIFLQQAPVNPEHPETKLFVIKI
jgi:hypothetical protein